MEEIAVNLPDGLQNAGSELEGPYCTAWKMMDQAKSDFNSLKQIGNK